MKDSTPASVTLKLQSNELDYVFSVLQQRPWGEVNALIQKLLEQANDKELQNAGNSPRPENASPANAA